MKTACRAGALEVQFGLEGRQLPTERVAAHLDVEDTEMVAVQHDHSRAGAEDRLAARDEVDERLGKALTLQAEADRRGLAARDHEAVESVEVCGRADLADRRAKVGPVPSREPRTRPGGRVRR